MQRVDDAVRHVSPLQRKNKDLRHITKRGTVLAFNLLSIFYDCLFNSIKWAAKAQRMNL
jgi:hypothetical protein